MVKTWKTDENAIAGMQIGSNFIMASVATAEEINGFYADESGTYIRGKLSLMMPPEQIRVGAFWVQQSGWRQMFPSTTAFPNPALILSPGLTGITNMAQSVGWMMSFLV